MQFVTTSRPSAFGKYELYYFIDVEDEFNKVVLNIQGGKLCLN